MLCIFYSNNKDIFEDADIQILATFDCDRVHLIQKA
jgi:hypothetical protein